MRRHCGGPIYGPGLSACCEGWPSRKAWASSAIMGSFACILRWLQETSGLPAQEGAHDLDEQRDHEGGQGVDDEVQRSSSPRW